MPIPTGGLIQLTLSGSYGGNTINNVFSYWNSLDIEPISFVGLAVDWDTKLLGDIASIINDFVTFDTITLRTIFGTLPDFVAIPSLATGARVGDASASSSAMGFLYSPTTKEVHPGGKRFVGVTEADTINNGYTVAFFTLLQTVATALQASITDGVNSFEPVVASRPKPTRATWAVGDVASITPYSTVRHQVSRSPSAS